MGDELRNNVRYSAQSERVSAAVDGLEDPTQTGSRRSRVHARVENERASELRPESQTGWRLPQAQQRISRVSVRPSAFGIPRVSLPPGVMARDSENVPRERESVPPAGSRPSSPGIAPRLAQSARKRAPSSKHPPVKTDIEELLPMSPHVKSLPRPPRMPTSFETPLMPIAASRRFPYASLAVFVVMLGASFAPLTRYRGERQESAARAAAHHEDVNAHGVGSLFALHEGARSFAPQSAAARENHPADQVERAFWGKPAQAREALLEEAESALSHEDLRLARALFERSLEFDGTFDYDDARAEYGLARIAKALGDTEGAESWALAAIQKRPRAVEYRALHAELLQLEGRGSEAQMERVVARVLAHFSHGTRAR